MKECIFKCQTGKVIVGVYKDPQRWGLNVETVYRVYCNRKWMWHRNWYNLKDAIQACVHVGLLGNYNVLLEEKV